MKIAIISTPVFRVPASGYSGLEVIAWQQAEGLARKGHEVYLIAPDGSQCPGAQVIPIGPERRVDERMAYGGFPEMREGDRVVRPAHPGYWQVLLDMDCIVDHSWSKQSILLKMEGRLKAPILGVLHAPVNTMYQTLPPVEKPCFVCISDDQRNHFEALFSHPARTCRNGIDIDFYRSISIPRTDRFLFLARFSTIKGPDLSIDACLKAKVGLDLVGDTSITNEPEFFQQCLQKADGKQIKIIGGVSRSETVYWYSQAFGFLHLNARFREPLGLAPLEGMACGLPCIAWKYGALRETVKHGETGFLVESLEQTVAYINALKEKTSHGMNVMREQCRDWVSAHFTVQRMIDRIEELCIEAVETGGW